MQKSKAGVQFVGEWNVPENEWVEENSNVSITRRCARNMMAYYKFMEWKNIFTSHKHDYV